MFEILQIWPHLNFLPSLGGWIQWRAYFGWYVQVLGNGRCLWSGSPWGYGGRQLGQWCLAHLHDAWCLGRPLSCTTPPNAIHSLITSAYSSSFCFPPIGNRLLWSTHTGGPQWLHWGQDCQRKGTLLTSYYCKLVTSFPSVLFYLPSAPALTCFAWIFVSYVIQYFIFCEIQS